MEFEVLANDDIHEEGIKLFHSAGINVKVPNDSLSGNDLLRDVRKYDVLLVRSTTKVSSEVIKAGVKEKGKLKMIGRAGVGFDNVDVKKANEYGIVVKIAPHGSTNATAELALGLMLSRARYLPQAQTSVANGIWRKKPFKGVELSNKTLGIIGCGRIGQRLSELVSGFGMEMLGYDANPELTKSRFPYSKIKYTDKNTLLKQSDFISLHTGGKQVVIGAPELELIKSTAILINASRGGNIDEEALYYSLINGHLRGVGLDSYVDEPKKEGQEVTKSMKKLANLDKVVLSSHLGASTEEAQIKTSLEMAEVTIGYLQRGDFTNAVNASETVEQEAKPTHSLFIYHADVPGMFGKLDSLMGSHGINMRDHPSRELAKGKASTVYLLHQPATPKVLEDIRALEGVYRAEV